MDKIDNLDKKILRILSQNARIPFKDVAAECGVSRAAIHQRVTHLMEAGIITGSGFDINPKSFSYFVKGLQIRLRSICAPFAYRASGLIKLFC